MRAVIGLLIPIAASLSGCVHFIAFGHEIDAPAAPATASTAVTAAAQPASSPAPANVSTVMVNFSATAKDEASASFKLQEASLREAIESELRSRRLLSSPAETRSPGRTVAISVDAFTARTTSNVIMFGQVFEAGTLTGDVTVRDGSGVAVQTYRIKANSHINRPAAGATTDTLTPLYKKFADLTVDNLSGAPRRPVDLTNTGMPH